MKNSGVIIIFYIISLYSFPIQAEVENYACQCKSIGDDNSNLTCECKKDYIDQSQKKSDKTSQDGYLLNSDFPAYQAGTLIVRKLSNNEKEIVCNNFFVNPSDFESRDIDDVKISIPLNKLSKLLESISSTAGNILNTISRSIMNEADNERLVDATFFAVSSRSLKDENYCNEKVESNVEGSNCQTEIDDSVVSNNNNCSEYLHKLSDEYYKNDKVQFIASTLSSKSILIEDGNIKLTIEFPNELIFYDKYSSMYKYKKTGYHGTGSAYIWTKKINK